MIKIAFAGNPNVGKTALINAIAGSKLQTGNWPGVTVEKKEAHLLYEGEEINLIDLPGVYSLSPYSLEEIITRDYILNEKPDVIINAVDSTNLERNLYMSLLLKELGKPMVLALNFYDEFTKLDYKLSENKFYEMFEVEGVKTSAKTGEGIQELLKKAIKVAKENKEQHHKEYNLGFDHIIEGELEKVKKEIEASDKFDAIKEIFHSDYLAIKFLEEDKHTLDKVRELYDECKQTAVTSNNYIEKHFDEDVETILAEARYGVIKGILAKTFTTSMKNRLDATNKIDKVLLNQFLGPISFVFIMLLIFTMTFNGSGPLIDFTDQFIADYIGKYVAMAVSGTPAWLESFVLDGLLGGLGGVLVFVPLIVMLYFFLAILEESGYMSRVAFLMDKIMRKIGLNGKAFLPMILGFGCSVPAIYATRTLEDEKSRRLTALMTPFMSCGARLPVYALFTAAFFGSRAGLVIAGLYAIGIFIAITVGFVFKNDPYFKTEEKALLIELPPYRLPSLKVITLSSLRKTNEYIKKAGTIILAMLVLIWALMYFPNDGDTETSYVGKIGKAVAPIFKPAGFGDKWQTVAAIAPGLVAKEVVVGFMGQALYIESEEEENEEEVTTFGQDTITQIVVLKDSLIDAVKEMISFNVTGLFAPPSEDEVEEAGGSGVISALRSLWADDAEGPLKAFSYMIFILLTIPCVVTLGAIQQEFGWKLFTYVIAIYLLVPYVSSTLIYQIGRLFV